MTLNLELLGRPLGYLNGKRLAEYKFKKPFALLCYLAIANKPVTRLKLASIFWPDHSEKNGLMNLRKALARLRKQVGNYIDANYHEVKFNTSLPYQLDLIDLSMLKQLDSHADIDRFIALYRGDFMEGFYLRHAEPFEEWHLIQITYFRNAYLEKLQANAQKFDSLGSHEKAIKCGEKSVEIAPTQESSHRDLMRWYAKIGNLHQMVQQYEICQSILQETLGINPSPITTKLYKELIQANATQIKQKSDWEKKIPLVGRNKEWTKLYEAYSSANQNQASIILIQGEAGSGKTRLAEELTEFASRRGENVIHTRAYAAQGDSFAPITNLLRHNMELYSNDIESIWQVELARLFPEHLVRHPDLPHPMPIKEVWQQHRFYEALVRCIQAKPGPILIHFDDLQWCDGESLAWLRFLLGSQHDERILVVGTVRDDEIEDNHPLNMMHYELQQRDQSQAIDLSPLGSGDLQILAFHMLGRKLPNKALLDLNAETEGSPLYAIELLREGTHFSESQPKQNLNERTRLQNRLPQKIYAVIKWRFGLLSSPARRLIKVAAVIGRSFSLDFLASVSGQDSNQIIHILDELWKRRIIREEREGVFDFYHDYFRDVAYDEISPILRRQLHNKAATALKKLAEAQLNSASRQIAVHLVKAGKSQEAAGFYERAGDFATSRFASNEALQDFEIALNLLPPEPLSSHLKLRLKREDVLAQIANMEPWRDELNLLDKLAQRLLEKDHTNIEPTIEFLLRISHYESVFSPTRISTAAPEKAIALSKQHKLVYQEARGYYILGNIKLVHSQYDQAAQFLQKAVDLAQRHGFAQLEANALEYLAVVSMFTGANANLIEGYVLRVLAHSKALKDIYLEASIYNKLGYLRVAQGESDLGPAEDYYQNGLKIAQEQKFAMLESIIGGNLTVLHIHAGNYEKAMSCMQQANEVAEQSGFGYFHGVRLNYAAFMFLHIGDYEQSKDLQLLAIKNLKDENRLAWLCRAYSDMGLLELIKGDFELALIYLDKALETVDQIGDMRQKGWALKRKGQALTKIGRFDKAQALLEESYEIHQSLDQFNHAMMAVAGLADLFAACNNLTAAMEQAERIFTYLQTNALDYLEESLFIYMAAYEVFKLAGDSRAQLMLEKAVCQLRKRAGSIKMAEEQKLFWEVDIHAAVLSGWKNA